MHTYYRIPVTMEEIYPIRFIQEAAANKYFKNLVESPRPDHVAPAIVFEKDSSYPGELFGIVFGEEGTLVHFFYFSTDKVILPMLGKHRIKVPVTVNIPAFEEFKAENSRLNTIFHDNLALPVFLEDARSALPRTQAHPRTHPVMTAVMLVLLSLVIYLISHRHRKNRTIDVGAVEGAVNAFIKKINDPRKRAVIKRQVERSQQWRQKLLSDPEHMEKILSFINHAARDDRVAGQVDKLLQTIQDDNTRRVLQNVIEKTKRKTFIKTTDKPALRPLPPPSAKPQSKASLYQFVRQFRQDSIVRPSGSVSPAFTSKLTSFLPEGSPIVRSLTSRARRIASQNPELKPHQVKNELLRSIATQQLLQEPEPKPDIFTISPARKPRNSRRLPKTQQKQQQKQQQQKPRRAEVVQLVERKPNQLQQGAAIIEFNIQRILQDSKTYHNLIETLKKIIQSRQIKKVYVVDAPNMLGGRKHDFTTRQKVSASPEFAQQMRMKLKIPTNDTRILMVVVSQMNRTDWVKDDPVYVSRIGEDEENVFLVRVGCFYDDEGVDCHKSKHTNYHNECDDFVRHDLIARLSHDDPAPPEFIHVTNDKGRNWSIKTR